MAATEARLIKLACQTTEDGTGADEAYLTLNGARRWGPESMNDGQVKSVNYVETFNGQCRVDLYDEDSPDADDWLGGIAIGAWELNQGTRAQTFSRDDAHYTLFYRVNPSGDEL